MKRKTWHFGLLAILFSFLASPIGGIANIASAGLIFVALGWAILRRPKRQPIDLLLLIVAISLYWTIELLNTNVPSISIGLLGWRKSILFFVAVALGVLWLRDRVLAGVWLIRIILVACWISLAIHNYFPDYEASITRAAGQWTSEFQGETRMQGIFAGPFHVALAGSFLFLVAFYAFGQIGKVTALLCLLTGVATVAATEVRTGYVTMIIGALIWTVMRLRNRRTLFWLTLCTACLATVLLVGPSLSTSFSDWIVKSNPVLASLSSISTDSRFLGRFDTWMEAFQAIRQAPLLGWGPGSAGDAMGDEFSNGVHVTSHNVGLKYFVEGGIVGGGIVAVCVLVAVVGLIRSNAPCKPFGIAAALCLFAFGSTGAIVEAIPVSLVLAIFIGMAQPRSRVEGTARSRRQPHPDSTIEPRAQTRTDEATGQPCRTPPAQP